MAIANAAATSGVSYSFQGGGTANATSYAETTKGALAQAQSSAGGVGGEYAQSTAKTSLAGVSVESTAQSAAPFFFSVTTSMASAAGGGPIKPWLSPVPATLMPSRPPYPIRPTSPRLSMVRPMSPTPYWGRMTSCSGQLFWGATRARRSTSLIEAIYSLAWSTMIPHQPRQPRPQYRPDV